MEVLLPMNHTHAAWDWADHRLTQLSSWVEMELNELNLNTDIIQPKTVIAVVTLGLSTPLLLLLILCAISYSLMTMTRQAKLLSKFPHYWKFPLIGNIWAAPFSEAGIFRAISSAVRWNGRRFVFWIGHIPFVVLVEGRSIQKILSSTKHVEKSGVYSSFNWLFGNGLITSKADIWKDDRKLLSPVFKYQRLDGFLAIFNKYSHTLISILESTCSGKETVLHPIICRATLDFINESALGQPSHFQYELDSKFMEAVHMILNNFRTRLLKPYLTLLPVIWDIFGLGKEEPICKEITGKIVRDVIKSRKEKKLEHNNTLKNSLNSAGSLSEEDEESSEPGTSSPFIDALIPTKSDADILAHVLTICGAGFETTASGMNYTLFLLALNPHLQAKVHAELDSVVGHDKDVTFAHLAELKYLEMCIKEALRLYPPAPIFLRSLKEDVELDDGLTIPSGCDVCFILYELHRDPQVFPDPEAFIPERFLPEACAARHPYAYIPFSAGPRNCLGLKYAMIQMKACLALILRHFTVSTTQKRKDIRLVYGMVLEPFPAIKVTLTLRPGSNHE